MILVYLENSDSTLPKGAQVTIDAALKAKAAHGYSKVVGVLLGGEGVEVAASAAAKFGLEEILFVKSSALAPYLALNFVAALAKVVEEVKPTLLIAGSTSRGKDFIPRVAQRFEAGQASDVLAFNSDKSFKRPMYAGNILADVEITTPIKVVTVRQSAFSAVAAGNSISPIREIKLDLTPAAGQQFVSYESVKSERPELSDADIIVSGGRALKSAENFQTIIAPLADQLGAAIGASRAAVDSGYAPNDWQVGQTGKVVAPNLYIAVGISGAIQHLAGMKDSKVIVAINQDPEAPIFEAADYGLVEDLYKVVPELTEELKKRRS